MKTNCGFAFELQNQCAHLMRLCSNRLACLRQACCKPSLSQPSIIKRVVCLLSHSKSKCQTRPGPALRMTEKDQIMISAVLQIIFQFYLILTISQNTIENTTQITNFVTHFYYMLNLLCIINALGVPYRCFLFRFCCSEHIACVSSLQSHYLISFFIGLDKYFFLIG